jgi:hypothetical protein
MRWIVACLLVLAPCTAQAAQPKPQVGFVGTYHEAFCPSVDLGRMPRMTRDRAVAMRLLPARDCHPELRVTYLGVSGSWGSSGESSTSSPQSPRTVPVRSYTRGDGTQVRQQRALRHDATDSRRPSPRAYVGGVASTRKARRSQVGPSARRLPLAPPRSHSSRVRG